MIVCQSMVDWGWTDSPRGFYNVRSLAA